MRELDKTYDPKSFEGRIYEAWERDGDFSAKPDPKKKPFTIVMPPPNITGQLHMGHALDNTFQDVLTRWRRLQGYEALWVPGTDHASIATEVKVADDLLEKEGKTKEDIGRDEFLARAWKWKDIYGGKITEQLRRLGFSCDWNRERFTMDDGCNKAVIEFFIELYEKGLIYKGNRIINWCPVCGTSLSDIEVQHEDLPGKYWYFRYPAADGGEGITVATSRPETIFADVAIAVSPGDARYAHLIGKTVLIPLVGKEIPVIEDSYPDPEKGTGAVKITPAHDMNDYEVGQRHGLLAPVCIDFEGKMTELAGEYVGLDRYECRDAFVKALDEGGYLVKTEDVVIPTGKCYRCDTAIEPMVSDQWFVSMKPLAEPAIAAIKKGELKFVPQRFEKIYLKWLEEIRDWCISRQLWWGHRIPAYYCDECGEVTIAAQAPEACPKCGAGADKLHQEEDVLDTWFSSGLWPFSTLGWPDETEDMKYFYPTSVLVTGYDIIFFWVARMVFSAYAMTDQSPFEYVYVHGIVRDEQGRKMSKSLGNGIDPLEVIDEYGADALRFFLLNGSAAGNDMRFITKSVESTRNFANKLWNASRFVIMNLGDIAPAGGGSGAGKGPVRPGSAEFYALQNTGDYGDRFNDAADIVDAMRAEDKWILALAEKTAREVTENLEKFEFSVASQKIYEFIRDEYCDWYIELVKERLYGEDGASKQAARATLQRVLTDILRLLHPFMPFITEEIWSYLGKPNKLIVDKWPVGAGFESSFASESESIESLKDTIRAVRNIRAEAGTEAAKKVPLILTTDPGEQAVSHIKNLASVSDVSFIAADAPAPEDAASAILKNGVVYVPLSELVDYEAEKEKLAKEKQNLEGNIARLEGKLANEGFTAKAPEKVIAGEREKLADAKDALEKVERRLAELED